MKTTSAYKQLDGDSFKNLQKMLLREKGSIQQTNFIENTINSKDFLAMLDKEVTIENRDGIEPSINEEKLTEQSYIGMPFDIEKQCYENWRKLTLSQASSRNLWGYITKMHIDDGKIEAAWLAGNGSNANGKKRIEMALDRKSNDSKIEIDRCVRTILRRFSGLAERGNRSVYSDCCFGRAFWRYRLVKKVCDYSHGVTEDQVHQVLKGKDYWERIAQIIVSRNSTIGAHEVQAALVVSLLTKWNDEEFSAKTSGGLTAACKFLSSVVAGRELSLAIMGFNQITEVTDDAVNSVAKIQDSKFEKSAEDE